MNCKRVTTTLAAMLLLAGCTTATTTSRAPAPASAPSERAATGTTTAKVDPQQAARLQRIWVPLIQAMNHPIPLNQVKVGILDDPHINAANAGGGEFYVTTGLLQKANDDELRAVLAHETAHADLGHVAKLQRLGAGLSIGAVILDQIVPGASALAPLAGQLVANAYTRKEEYQADAHGVELLDRAGYPGKQEMASTLQWLMQTEGASGGGFFATHPATGDRIKAVEALPGR